MKKLLAIAFVSLCLTGCGFFNTDVLNRPQCLNADWFTYGLSEGANGTPLGNMQAYQMSCAKYNVKVDPDAFIKGHERGVRTFCTPSRAFEYGKSGAQYLGVCPADLEGPFLEAYSRGNALHLQISELDSISNQIRAAENQIDALKEKKKQLINDKNPEIDRGQLIRENDEINEKLQDLEGKIRKLNKIKEEKEYQFGIHDGSYL